MRPGNLFGYHYWALDVPPNADRQMQDYRRAVLRKIDSNYRRSARQWADSMAATEDQVDLTDGTILELPGMMGLGRRRRGGRPPIAPASAPRVSQEQTLKVRGARWSFLIPRHLEARGAQTRKTNSRSAVANPSAK